MVDENVKFFAQIEDEHLPLHGIFSYVAEGTCKRMIVHSGPTGSYAEWTWDPSCPDIPMLTIVGLD